MAKKIGELLVEKGAITKEQLEIALKRQSITGEKLGHILVKLGFVDEEKFYKLLAEQFNINKFDKDEFIITKEAQNCLSLKTVVENEIIPLEKKENKLFIGFSNFTILNLIKDFEFESGCKVYPFLMPDNMVKKIIIDFQNFPYGLKDYKYKSLKKYLIEKYNTFDVDLGKVAVLIDELEQNYTQIIFTDGEQPFLKKNSAIFKVDYKLIKHTDILNFIKLYLSEGLRKKLVEDNNIKINLNIYNKTFLCSILKQRGKYNVILSPVSKHIPDIVSYDIEQPLFRDLISMRGGLYLIAAPHGHGKSTFMSSIASHFSKNLNTTIIYIDEFIMYRFESDYSYIMQIELGSDAENLKDALLLDKVINSNIIFIGLLNNLEEFVNILQLAEAGKKVFISLETPDITSAISYINSLIEKTKDYSIRERFANVLRVCLAQRLVNLRNSIKKLYIYEYMRMNLKVKRLIVENAISQINSQVKGSSDYIPLEKKFADLIKEGVLEKDDIFNYSLNYDILKTYINL
ncbi:hypothetical protein OWM07_01555 [Deferribacter thermophilus]|uniref:hypothetical protein n=1 Tax=Deferribacter thermophilus TaxID=53573 RepID=UPI003C1874AB